MTDDDAPRRSAARTLTIVVPLFNAGRTSARLLAHLGRIDDPAIDMILVDDGSSDDTVERAREWQAAARCRTQLIVQDNRGPGGARNRGLAAACGDYVWFIDADDDFDDDALTSFHVHAHEDVDFIEIGYRETTSVVPGTARLPAFPFAPGIYEADPAVRHRLLDRFNRVLTKIYRRGFLVSAQVAMPEHCIYEDTPWFFEMPLLTRRFRVVPGAAYICHRDELSVTRVRGPKPPRFFDRLWTAAYAVRLAELHPLSAADRQIVERKFVNIALIHTTAFVWAANRDWRTMLRVMRWYRDAARDLRVRRDPLRSVTGRRPYRLLFRLLWHTSRALPRQDAYFTALHDAAWRHPIIWPRAAAAPGLYQASRHEIRHPA